MSKLILSRFVIETKSPLALCSGDRDAGFDTSLAKDWNGLPYIPATSLAGVLSSVATDYYKDLVKTVDSKSVSFVDYWFGSTRDNDHASRLIFSDGLVVDDNSELSFGIRNLDNLSFLRKLKFNIENRERCRINQRGVSMDKGKFDNQILPTGVRFTFDIISRTNSEITDDEKYIEEFNSIIALINTQSFRLGGNTKTGLGEVKVIGFEQKVIDLAKEKTAAATKIRDFMSNIKKLPKDASNFPKSDESKSPLIKLATLNMKAIDSWSIGSGVVAINKEKAENAKKFCYTEPFISWNAQSGKVIDDPDNRNIVICGTMLKGIIAHRTEFHYRKLTNSFAENMTIDNLSAEERKTVEIKTVSSDLRELLGYIDDDTNKSASTKKSTNGKSSALIVKETCLGTVKANQNNVVVRTHNKIDKFTSKTMSGALFSEERLYHPSMTFEIFIRKDRFEMCSKNALKALYYTLCDIKEGFLPIASGSSRQGGFLEALQGSEIAKELESVINE